VNAKGNRSNKLSSEAKPGFIGVFLTLLAASLAFSQSAAREPGDRGSGSVAAAQQQPTTTASVSDRDREIVQELEAMRKRIEELEAELKERRADRRAAQDPSKSASEDVEQLVGGSESGAETAAQGAS